MDCCVDTVTLVFPDEDGEDHSVAGAAPCAVEAVWGVVFLLVVEVVEGVQEVGAGAEIVQGGPAVEGPQGVASGRCGGGCGGVGWGSRGGPVEDEASGDHVAPLFVGDVDSGEAGGVAEGRPGVGVEHLVEQLGARTLCWEPWWQRAVCGLWCSAGGTAVAVAVEEGVLGAEVVEAAAGVFVEGQAVGFAEEVSVVLGCFVEVRILGAQGEDVDECAGVEELEAAQGGDSVAVGSCSRVSVRR